MNTQVFGFLTLRVKQRDALLRGKALDFFQQQIGPQAGHAHSEECL
jgi:hypothetical protein